MRVKCSLKVGVTMCAMYCLFDTLQGKTFHWNIILAIWLLASSLNFNSVLLFDRYQSFNDIMILIGIESCKSADILFHISTILSQVIKLSFVYAHVR